MSLPSHKYKVPLLPIVIKTAKIESKTFQYGIHKCENGCCTNLGLAYLGRAIVFSFVQESNYRPPRR